MTKNYIITDLAVDDLQAIYYLSENIKIDGIIFETGVSDLETGIRNIILFKILFLKKDIPIYFGDTKLQTNVPIPYRLDSSYALLYQESIFFNKFGRINYLNLDFLKKLHIDLYNDYNILDILSRTGEITSIIDNNCCTVNFPSLWTIDFTDSIIISTGRATTLVKILEKFKINNFYTFLGGVGDPFQFIPIEFNAFLDIDAYSKILKYVSETGIGKLFTTNDLTPENVKMAEEYSKNKGFLYDIINPPSREFWLYWDLVMVMTFFPQN